MNTKYKYTFLACCASSVSMSVVSNLPPLLFLTFRQMYGISFSLLGLLVVMNFFTQLIIDLIFSFFSHRFNIPKTVKSIPLFTFAGLVLFALAPVLFPQNVFVGLVIGDIILAASSGLGEALMSPVVAAIPSDNPDRDMSKLHSTYAWGVVAVVILATLYIIAFGAEKWQWLTLLCTIVPIVSGIFFAKAEIPHMETPKKVSGALQLLKNKGVWLCFFAIFLGGSTECTMAQWASSYLENALSIPKVWGDIFGVAMFAAMLGIGRTMYAKHGTNITKVLFLGAVGATTCYFIAAVTDIHVLGLFACAFTGFCTSMLWPGTLIVASDRFPDGGVFIFALMAAGGDFGASVGPQLVGLITDFAISSQNIISLANNIGISPEQIGMKLGMLVGMFFPLALIPATYCIWKKQNAKS